MSSSTGAFLNAHALEKKIISNVFKLSISNHKYDVTNDRHWYIVYYSYDGKKI